MSASSIKVVVRVRPLSDRERSRNAQTVVQPVEGVANSLMLCQPKNLNPSLKEDFIGTSPTKRPPSIKQFTFDSVYVPDSSSSIGAEQEQIFNNLGKELLDHSFEGYNSTILAYGQTSSGKSYTMMGHGADSRLQGLIPRICRALFERIQQCRQHATDTEFNVEVSYLEIYCEKVKDLLNPSCSSHLRIREHPIMGPYVEDLSKISVQSKEAMEELLDLGNKTRTVCATNMNEMSSRSHAIFTIVLTQRRPDTEGGSGPFEKTSRICLVDLAGSERANSTGATGERLKEGANINKSLTTLGKVISTLAECSTKKLVSGATVHVPYRDSVLTWLLKDSLGGNSKTVMVAAVSPADFNFDETLSTLRYAERAKQIVNKAVINEDANAKLIRELKEEVLRLQSQLQAYSSTQQNSSEDRIDLRDQLSAAEKLMSDLNKSWEQKLGEAQNIALEREKALEELGILVTKTGPKGTVMAVSSPRKMPYLVNISEDPSMSECLIYPLRPGITKVGSDPSCHIRLEGDCILSYHCQFDNSSSVISLIPGNSSLVTVNGNAIHAPVTLKTGSHLIIGDHHCFRYVHPKEAKPKQTRVSSPMDMIIKKDATIRTVIRHDLEQSFADSVQVNNENQLEEQLKSVETEADEQKSKKSSDPPLSPTKRNRLLARKVVEKWRKYKFVSLLESIIKYTPLVKEANIIGREIDMDNVFRLEVVTQDVQLKRYVSFWDLQKSTEDYMEDPNLKMASLPCLVVRNRNQYSGFWFLWSLEKFDEYLSQLRRSFNQFSRPTTPLSNCEYLRHCGFKLHGTSKVWLNDLESNLLEQKSLHKKSAIVSTLTGAIIGQIDCQFSVIDSESSDDLLVEIHLNSMRISGYQSEELGHCQYHLSSLDLSVPFGSESDKIYATTPMQIAKNDVCTIDYRQIIRLKKSSILETDWSALPFCIEIFAHSSVDIVPLNDDHAHSSLDDFLIERFQQSLNSSLADHIECQNAYSTPKPGDRHLVCCSVEVKELSSNGEYVPAAVITDSLFPSNDPGSFLLHQGVQRRVCVVLACDSAEKMRWLGISRMKIGNVRRISISDKAASIANEEGPEKDICLNILPFTCYEGENQIGQKYLTAEASWDSSLHESPFLNKNTNDKGRYSSRTRISVTLTCEVSLSGSNSPIVLEQEVYLQILPRSADNSTYSRPYRSGLFASLFSSRSCKSLDHSSSYFWVTYMKKNMSPNMNSSSSLSESAPSFHTVQSYRGSLAYFSKQYIRGEEVTSVESEDGFELLLRRLRLDEKISIAEAVDRTRQWLSNFYVARSVLPSSRSTIMMEMIIDCWIKKPIYSSITSLGNRKIAVDSVEDTLSPVSMPILLPEEKTHRGYLSVLKTPTDSSSWEKYWFVLRRPLLIIYKDKQESQELAVIGLDDVKTQWNLIELEENLQRSNLFFVYTKFRGYMLQASSNEDLMGWLSAIDPLQIGVLQSNKR